MSRSRTTTYRTRDLSLAAHLYAQGARVKSIQDREFFLETPPGSDAIEMAIGYIGSADACYDQSIRALKKVVLEWNRMGIVGREGQWSLEGRMEVAAFLCHQGGRLVGFERVSRRGRKYITHFDDDPAWCESIVGSWPSSGAQRFDAATRELKSMSRGA